MKIVFNDAINYLISTANSLNIQFDCFSQNAEVGLYTPSLRAHSRPRCCTVCPVILARQKISCLLHVNQLDQWFKYLFKNSSWLTVICRHDHFRYEASHFVRPHFICMYWCKQLLHS